MLRYIRTQQLDSSTWHLTETFGTDVSIVMTSMTGAVVKDVKTTNNGLIQVDASDLSEGVYVVKVLSGNKVATQKITITK